MSTPFSHSPADIVRWLLIDKGVGTDPTSQPLQQWPVYATGEPSTPDDVITVYNTASKEDGRSMIDGEDFHHFGLQIRVRGTTDPDTYARVELVHTTITEHSYQDLIEVGSVTYLVWSFSNVGAPLSLGKDAPNSKRSLYTLNCLASIKVQGDH